MLPSFSWILAKAINAKILTKNLSDSHIPTLIPHILTPIPRIPTLILHVPIIPLISLPDSPFQVLQIALFMTFI